MAKKSSNFNENLGFVVLSQKWLRLTRGLRS